VRAARPKRAAEDPIARYERRRAWYQSRLIIITPVMIAVAVVLGCGPTFVLQKIFHGAGWLHRPWGTPLLIGDPILVAIGLSAWTRRFSPPKQFFTDAVLASRSDSLQQQRWSAMLLVTAALGLVLTLLISMWSLLPPLPTILPFAALSWLMLGVEVAIPVLLSLVLLACLFGGRLSGPPALQRAMDDELTVVQRAKAVTTGFLVLLATLVLLMAAGAFAPPIVTRMGLIVCAYCGLAAASIRFALLERAAHLAARND
jgi:hypothetical protein